MDFSASLRKPIMSDITDCLGEAGEYMTNPTERRRFYRRASDYQADQFHGIFTTFEQVGRHVFLLDDERRAIYKSGGIDQLLSQAGVPLRLKPLFTLDEAHNARQFQIFFDSIQATETPTEPNCIMLLQRSNSSPLLLSCFPLPNHNGDGTKILGILSDPCCVADSQWRAFQNLFGLTAAELRLCLSLSEGLSLADFSQRFQVTEYTARSQLKSVFAKTDSRRQSDLVRLIFLLTRL